MQFNIPTLKIQLNNSKDILLATLPKLDERHIEQQEKIQAMLEEIETYFVMLQSTYEQKATFLEGSDSLKLNLHRFLEALTAYCAQIDTFATQKQ